MNGKKIVLALKLMVVAFVSTASAQVSLTGTNYIQNFDANASGLSAGWSVRTNADATGPGTAASFTIATTTWGNTSGQFANYASAVSNNGTNFLGTESSATQNACTNRALAVRQVATRAFDPGAAFVFQILNTTNRSNFKLSLDFVTLNVQNRWAVWTVDYAIGNTPSSFTPVGTFADPQVFGKTNVTFSFGSSLDDKTNTVWIRIVALSVTTPGTGSRDTFGIDNFSLSWTTNAGDAVPPAPIPLHIESIGNNVVLTWSNSLFALQESPSLTGAYTNVPGAISPHTNPVTAPQMYFRLKAN